MVRRLAGALTGAMVLASVSLPLAAQESKKPEDPEQEELPLEVARHLRSTATEGSWMSVDVSPDGRTVVFDHLGDLFTVPLTGGRATRLTRGMGSCGGNSLEDLRNSTTIDRVMKNGRIYDGDTLDEVWPRQRRAGPFYWQKDPATPSPSTGIR